MKNKEIRDLKESQVVIRRLKKELEQKNRELKIESGLERVRTRAMAMKNSEELADLVATVFNELVHLGFVLTRCYIYIIDPDSLSLRAWTFNTEIGQLPESYHIKYLDLPYYKALINAWKAKKPKFVYELGGAEKKEVDRILFNETEYSRLPEGVKTGMASVDRVFLSYSFNNFGGLQTGGLEQLSDDQMDILYRFGKVFDLTYTRFSDLKQAEAQAREAQIEAALERVRARTMAMRKSEELFEVVNHLYAQIEPFGISTLGISLAIFLEEEDALEYWYSDHLHSNLVKSYKVRGRKHPVYQKIWKGWKNKDPFLKIYLEGDKKREYDDFILKETDFIHLPEELKNDMYNIKVVHFTYSFIKYGIFEAVDLAEPVEENVGLLIRFSKVFEQAYTRFLDLQKAEAQAREAQIEAALERVRSRSMAMRKSEELHEVVNTAFEQILLLNLSLDTCTIDLYENDMKDWKWWSATEGQVYPELFKLPFRKFKIMIDRHKAKKEGRSLVTGLMNKHQSQQFWNYFFQHIDIPPDRRKYLLQKNGIATSSLIFKNTGMTGIRYEQVPFSDEENLILKRFAQSFEQTYTRFLDLKKAEAQAREAQIEAALERVRARTMAMHQSSELSEAGSLLFKQLIVLGIEAESSWITLISPEEDSMVIWLTHGTQMAPPRKVKASDHPNFRAEIESWKSGEEFIKISMTKGAFNLASRETFDMELENDYTEEKLVHIQNLRHQFGFLGLATLEPISDTEIAIYNRFTKVFEQTYTRFLDLQKAEKQAREAQIEAALERVRSRSMAMHKSEELRELVFEFYKQIQPFGFAKWGFEIKIAKEDKSGFYCWISPPGARIQPEGFNIPTLDHWVLEKYWSIFENRLPIAAIEVSGDDKKRLGLLLLKKSDMKHLPQEVKTNILDTDYVHFSVASMRYGLLKAVDIEPIPEKEINILQRFAKVFEQTYTRFLDLQKAEAQAREAEIQLALERVRARTMAMHRSDELREVVSVLYEQMIPLGLAALGCELILCDEENEQLQYWSAVPEQARLPECYPIQKIIHPFFQKVWKAWKKRTPRLVVTLKGQDKRKFDKLIFEKTAFKNFPEKAKNAIRAGKVDVFSLVTMKYGLLEAADVIPLPESKFTILERFAKVFEQTYTRFLDLQKAEAQAREAQIEASLERVRSRTMAMHKSEELSEAATVLFQQLRSLGGNLWSAGFVLLEKNEEGEFRMSNPEGEIQLPIYIPNTEDPATKNMYIHWMNGADYYAEEAGGQELKNHYNYLVSLPKARAAFQAIMDAGIDLPTWQQWHAAYFSQGYLLVITLEPYKEIDLLKRFAKAFQQTYTRFLDLQKAEAQAREAQIEAALERVRSRSIAMRKSEEIADIAGKIFSELRQLDLDLNRVLIWTFNDIEKYTTWWSSNPEVESTAESYRIDYNEHPVFINYLQAWQQRKPIYLFTLSGDTKKTWEDHLFEHTEMSRLPMAVRKGMREEGTLYTISVISDYGLMMSGSFEPLSEANIDIIQRFGRVFQQSYTRYLDVQKAEKQAREAQIEAALEKVRSRSLAMHQAEELGEVASVVFEKLRELGIPVNDGVAIVTHIEGSKDQIEWMESPDYTSALKVNLPYFDHPVLSDYWKAKNEGLEFIAPRYTAEENKSFLNHIFEYSDYKYAPQEVKDYCLAAKTYSYSAAFQKNSSIFINDYSGRSLSEQEIDIVKRFSKVFEQAYVRFLDLQKAETQARESEIQLALERVRARTMAMHLSDELDSVASVLFHQLQQLDIPALRRCLIGIIDETHSIVQSWYTSMKGDSSNLIITYPMDGHPVIEEKIKGWRQQKPFSIELSGKKMEDFLAYAMRHGFELQKREVAAKHMIQNHAPFKYGYLEVATHEPISNQDFHLLQRFAKVFEQTYTRFLDLIKAEAQAREAEIQLALERIRARALAMHHSDELQEVVNSVFEQMKSLDLSMNVVSIFVFRSGVKDWEQWVATSETDYFEHFLIPYVDLPVFNDLENARKEGKEFYSVKYSTEEKNEWFTYAFKHTDYRKIPAKRKKYLLQSDFFEISFALSRNIGIQIAKYEGNRFTDEENMILNRFAQVFEQAYTRFLDLKKAESQAREAQIEAALERVRSRSIGMQKSEELKEVIQVVYEQFIHLKINVDHAGFVVDYLPKGDWHFWVADQQEIPSKITHPYFDSVWAKQFDEAKEKGVDFFTTNLNFEEKNKFYQDLFSYIPGISEQSKDFYFNCPGLAASNVLLDNVALYIENFSAIPYTDEENKILMRFGKVFQQTYTRFLDLQKAEKQAREAEIQLALERVRAKTMAMHKSDELSDTASIMFRELKKLGIHSIRTGVCIFDFDQDTAELWLATEVGDKTETKVLGKVSGDMHPMYRHWIDAGVKKKKLFQYKISGKELNNYYDIASAHLNLPEQTVYNKSEIYYGFFFSGGSINVIAADPLTEEELDIGSRFANVFGLLYRRFLDLQKAEAQAREAQIEAALEKVRSRTMGMQHSNELQDSAMLLFQQVEALGVPVFGCGFNIWDDDRKEATAWMAGKDRLQPPFKTSSSEDIFLRIYEAAEKGESLFVEEQGGEALKTHYQYMNSIRVFKEIATKMAKVGQTFPTFQIMHCAFFSHGYLMFISFEPVQSAYDIFKRFAKVFEQTYTRFLDLQKAEAQAREALIESSLERVRSRSLAMHKTEELTELIGMIFTELGKLDVVLLRCVIAIYEPVTFDSRMWMANTEDPDNPMSFFVKYVDLPPNRAFVDAWKKRLEKWVYLMKGEVKKEWDKRMLTETELSRLPESVKIGMSDPAPTYCNTSFNTYGCLNFVAPKPISIEQFDLLIRFSRVFDQAYTRFNDIQKAEAQAREAVKQASLDRVRGEIASMRTADDLEHITPLIWKELINLSVPFIRCGVFIMNQDKRIIDNYLSTPDGKAIAAFHLPYDTPGFVSDVLSHWQKKQIFIEHWDARAMAEFADVLVNQGIFSSPDQYLKTLPKKGFYLHLLPFLQGMLYVGNTEQLSTDAIDLLQSLAGAFSTAYARYDDFNKLELAKKQVDQTLVELKQAQQQLIQSEKMASLGELTAGIAHEIQNPLNFVNNFSEVNKELLAELEEAILIGDSEEVKAIAKDISDNQEKINHHGKRAEGIVKGMLQHSRSSTGQKEATDINALCDEYLRLAYHGFRAKDKSFNAEYKLELDNSLTRINVVQQDIGRVLLNLINNAFFAVTEKKKSLNPGDLTNSKDPSYSPIVSISSKKQDNQVVITVSDNGNGIPVEIKDKIFQPFFTTKPTGQGTGLGLSLSYDIIKAHGGEIKINSNPGLGSEFIIHLPVY